MWWRAISTRSALSSVATSRPLTSGPGAKALDPEEVAGHLLGVLLGIRVLARTGAKRKALERRTPGARPAEDDRDDRSAERAVLRALPDDEPVVMLNLMRFREKSLDGKGSGWDAYLRYSGLAIKLIKAQGWHHHLDRRAEAVALGVPDAHRWDYVALVRYPSRAAFLAMMSSPEYAIANVERENGCADHAIVAMRETYNKLANARKEIAMSLEEKLAATRAAAAARGSRRSAGDHAPRDRGPAQLGDPRPHRAGRRRHAGVRPRQSRRPPRRVGRAAGRRAVGPVVLSRIVVTLLQT